MPKKSARAKSKRTTSKRSSTASSPKKRSGWDQYLHERNNFMSNHPHAYPLIGLLIVVIGLFLVFNIDKITRLMPMY